MKPFKRSLGKPKFLGPVEMKKRKIEEKNVDKSEVLIDILGEDRECCVCLETLRIPIMTCTNGHNLCQVCQQALHNCPQCQSPNFYRNRFAEKIIINIKTKCCGCSESFPSELYKLHELNCESVKCLKCDVCDQDIIHNLYVVHVKNHFSNKNLDEKLEIKIKQNEKNNLDDVAYTRSEKLFKWSMKTCENYVGISAKLFARKESLALFKVKISVKCENDSIDFIDFPLMYDDKSDNCLVKIPNEMYEAFVRRGPILVTGEVIKLGRRDVEVEEIPQMSNFSKLLFD